MIFDPEQQPEILYATKSNGGSYLYQLDDFDVHIYALGPKHYNLKLKAKNPSPIRTELLNKVQIYNKTDNYYYSYEHKIYSLDTDCNYDIIYEDRVVLRLYSVIGVHVVNENINNLLI